MGTTHARTVERAAATHQLLADHAREDRRHILVLTANLAGIPTNCLCFVVADVVGHEFFAVVAVERVEAEALRRGRRKGD